MAIGNIGSVEGTFAGAITTSDTVSAAVPSLGSERMGVVLITRLHSAARTVTGVTWDGVAMTQAVVEDTHANYRAAVFYLDGCAHNGTYDIVVTYSSTAVAHTSHITVAWADATGAISLDDTSSAQGTTQNPTVTSTQAGANEWVVSASCSSANALGAPSVTDCTLLQDYDAGGDCFVSAYSSPASSGDVTHQHNYSQSGTYAIVSASFQEAGGGGGATDPGWAGAGWW